MSRLPSNLLFPGDRPRARRDEFDRPKGEEEVILFEAFAEIERVGFAARAFRADEDGGGISATRSRNLPLDILSQPECDDSLDELNSLKRKPL
ncbi:hypothetical protein [Oxynema aestuarii]|uniref:Uncharacterized protein n=1 Tax=Oxynema aestuarii AP17 TaxID=2064643 RepID=A0A6H1TUV0_9CYAN|nr:hypothetical protein [Oxynema aestuarii]QIZ70195.1 hypothetical protein HCG48_06110 [Oxynema aestuarii AP17]RMH72533.1 MAG: hypothetical protein D6680_18890 [Cyanobacteria bacterium J007]